MDSRKMKRRRSTKRKNKNKTRRNRRKYLVPKGAIEKDFLVG